MNFTFRTSNRNNLIDNAKGIGIILVVAGHNYILMQQFPRMATWIYSFHMPLFFMLSGIFLNPNNKFKNFIIGKIDSILKPYFFGLVLIGLLFFRSTIEDFSAYVFGFLYGSDYTLGAHGYPLWFLPALFIALTICFIFLKALDRFDIKNWQIAVFSVALLISGATFIRHFNPYNYYFLSHLELPFSTWLFHGAPWSLDIEPIICAYVLLGYAFKNIFLRFSWSPPIMLISAIAFFSLFFLHPGTLDLAQRRYDSIFVTTIKTFLGTYLAISLSALFVQFEMTSKFLSFLGRNSLTVLIFHAALQEPIWKYLIHIGISWRQSAIASVILTIAGSIVLYHVISRVKLLRLLLLPKQKLSNNQTDFTAKDNAVSL